MVKEAWIQKAVGVKRGKKKGQEIFGGHVTWKPIELTNRKNLSGAYKDF